MSKGNLKIFFITFTAMFLIVTLRLSGVKPPRIFSPVPHTNDKMDIVIPKLEARKNTYSLRHDNGFIKKVNAAEETAADESSAYAVIDYDTAEILAKKNSSDRLPIASLTKIMSAVVTLDLATKDEIFTANKIVTEKEPTKIALKVGEKMTVEETLHAVLMTSANDAAELLAQGINHKYGQNVFIKAMNAKAEFLGLHNTHFTNAQGFDNPENYSTAEDLAVLSHYALTHYPLIAEIVEKDYMVLPENQNHSEHKLYNWNGLLGVYPNVSGIKIGNTGEAGKTTVVISERAGKKILTVLLGAPGVLERDEWTAELLDEGFAIASNLPPINVTEEELRAKYATWYY